ncbi:hypothetical protein PIB30_096466, partial [Stylosanthes scabra]|nr:hypothetical protein [Stylosanthes scabra]
KEGSAPAPPMYLEGTRSFSFLRAFMDQGLRKFYAVRVGKIPGIYRSWDEVNELVTGFPGAQHKSFWSYEEANAGGDGRVDSVASQLRRCRVSSRVSGDPGASTSAAGFVEARVGSYCGNEVGKDDDSADWQSSAERLLGLACRSLGLGTPVFVPWRIQPAQCNGSYGFTIILPKSERDLEVVTYGFVAEDKGIVRKEAAELMIQRVLAATNGKMRMLEEECAQMKKLLGLG